MLIKKLKALGTLIEKTEGLRKVKKTLNALGRLSKNLKVLG